MLKSSCESREYSRIYYILSEEIFSLMTSRQLSLHLCLSFPLWKHCITGGCWHEKKKKRAKKTALIGEPETQETSTYRAGAFSFLCFLQIISAELHCFQLHWNKIYPLLRNGKEILLQPHTLHRELPTVLYFHAKGDVTMSVSRWYLLFLSWCSPGTPTLSAVAGWDKELPILCCPPLGS